MSEILYYFSRKYEEETIGKSNFIKKINFCRTRNCFECGKEIDYPDLEDVCEYFPFIDKANVAFEWRSLPFDFEEDEIKEYLQVDVEEFWIIVKNMKDEAGTNVRFPSLTKLTKLTEAVFALPHSNTEPERTFSDVNEIKDDKGNSTAIKLLNARCFGRSYCNACGLNELNYPFTKEHFELFQYSNLYSK